MGSAELDMGIHVLLRLCGVLVLVSDWKQAELLVLLMRWEINCIIDVD
jgi:hypothetical protein